MQKTELVSANFLLTLLRHLQQVHLADDIAEKILGCDVSELENAAANGSKIPASLYAEFYRYYLQTMTGANFGFPSNIGDMPGRYRMLYTIMVNSHTLGDALDKLHQFYQTFALSKQLFQLLPAEENCACCEMNFLMKEKYRHSEHEVIIAANLMSGFHRMLCWLTGLPIPLRKVLIKGQTPKHKQAYLELFDSDIEFNNQHTALVLDNSIFDYSIVQTEQSLEGFLVTFPASLFQNPQNGTLSTSERVRLLIGQKSQRKLPSLPAACKLLNLSENKLKQQLKDEHASYHQLIETCRKDQALGLLADNQLDLNCIAKQLGFPATSAFHRSFKRWTGSTPGEYRKQLRKEAKQGDN